MMSDGKLKGLSDSPAAHVVSVRVVVVHLGSDP